MPHASSRRGFHHGRDRADHEPAAPGRVPRRRGALAALGSGYNYARHDWYHYPLGHGLRSDAIHAAWHQGRPHEVEALQRQARQYLFALRALLWDLRKHVGAELFFWPARFHLPGREPINDPLLSRLAFFTRYESVVQCLNLRA